MAYTLFCFFPMVALYVSALRTYDPFEYAFIAGTVLSH